MICDVGSPVLSDSLQFKIVENSKNVTINLGQNPAAFPSPTFDWSRNGVPLNNWSFTYSSITFPVLSRGNAGQYQVSATNYVLESNTQQVGTNTGSFILDVICKINVLFEEQCQL